MARVIVTLDTNVVWDIVESKDPARAWPPSPAMQERFRFAVTDVTVGEILGQVILKPELFAEWVFGKGRLLAGLAWDAVLFRGDIYTSDPARSKDARGKTLGAWNFLKRANDGSIDPACAMARFGFERTDAGAMRAASEEDRRAYIETFKKTRDQAAAGGAKPPRGGAEVWLPIVEQYAARAVDGTYHVDSKNSKNDGFDLRIIVATFEHAGGPDAWILTNDAGIVDALNVSPAKGRAIDLQRFFEMNDSKA